MSGMFYRELLVNRRPLILLGVLVVLLSSVLFFQNIFGFDREMYILFFRILIYIVIFFLVGMIQPSLFEVDESRKWAAFISSTPGTGKEQIASKYYLVLFTSIMTLMWCHFCDGISGVLFGADTIGALICQILFVIQIFLRAVELPFIVRFGSRIGSTYKGIVFFVIFFLVAAYLLYGDLSVFGEADSLFDWFLNVLSGEGLSSRLLLLAGMVPYAAGGLFYASYKLSCKWYLKGAEYYDK